MRDMGLQRATVVSTRDPAGKGRVQLKIPAMFGQAVTDWVEPHAPTDTLPAPGDAVFVLFQGGDTSKMVYLARAAMPDLSPYATTSALAAETTARTNADATEVTARTNADATEVTARTNADALKANDNAVVHLTGNETVAGIKSFTGSLTLGGQVVVTTTDARLATGEDAKIMTLMGVL